MTQDNKKTAVFLPGTMSDWRVFQPQLDAVARQGWSIRMPSLVGFKTGREMVSDLLPRLPKRFALIGHSFGAVIAHEIARQKPGRITHLALMSTHPGTLEQKAAEDWRGCVVQARKEGLENFMRAALLNLYLPASMLPDSQAAETVIDMALDAGLEVWADQAEMMINRPSYLSKSELGAISAPTLVVGGAEDIMCAPDGHRQAAEMIPNAQLKILDGCMHMITLEKPAEITELLLGLLNR